MTVVANTADGTATVADGDYLAVTDQTVTIPAGSTSATVPVTIEPNESKHSGPIAFSLTLSQPNGAFLGTATGTANIVFGGTAISEFMAVGAAVAVQSTVAAQTVQVPVYLSGDTYAANCLVNTADGTATAADNAYVPITNGVVSFKSGQATTTVPVTIPAASPPTGNETFTVNLSDCNPGTVASQPTATVTIVGAADNGPSVEVAPAALQFGAVPEGVTETRQVTLTNTGGSAATITSSAPPGAGRGFTATTGLPAGTTIAPGASVTETVAFDPTAEGALTDGWTVNANDGLGARTITLAGTGLAPLTPTVSVDWINLVRPTSGTTTATFTLSLSAPSTSATSVTVRTVDGTATVANGDYVPISGRVVTFAPGQTTASVAVTVNGKVATHSYFGLQMVPPYAGVTVEDDYGRANLLEPGDLAHEFVYVGPASVIQNSAYAQTAEVPVTASPHTDTITCTVNTADDSAVAANGDYTAIVNGTVTLGSGVIATTVPVTIPPGTSIQPNRQFTLTLSACTPTNDVAEDPTGVVTINGAAAPSAPSVTTAPTNQSVMAGQPVTFAAAANGSPPPAVQWLSEAPGATSFSAVVGATSTTYTFSPTLAQNGTELEAVFTNALGSVTTTPATLTVTPGTGLALSASALAFGSVPEGITETHTFVVTNTSASALTITASAPPTAGQGFTATTSLPGGTTVAPGASVTETVAFTPDSQSPLSDSWSITANDGLGAHVIAFTGTGTAPLTPTVSVDWINLVRPTSGTTTATFTLSLSAPSPTATSVTVRTLDGTATVANGDYVPISGQVVTFAPGQTTASVAITVDGKVATHSYFGLQLIPPYSGVTVEDDYGRANLLEPGDLAHEFVYVGPAGVMQTTADQQIAEVPVTASPHTDTITCTVNTADGTATAADGDYTPIVNGTVTLGSGVIATTVPVTIPTSTVALPERAFTVTLSACTPTNDVAEDPTGVVTIVG